MWGETVKTFLLTLGIQTLTERSFIWKLLTRWFVATSITPSCNKTAANLRVHLNLLCRVTSSNPALCCHSGTIPLTSDTNHINCVHCIKTGAMFDSEVSTQSTWRDHLTLDLHWLKGLEVVLKGCTWCRVRWFKMFIFLSVSVGWSLHGFSLVYILDQTAVLQ